MVLHDRALHVRGRLKGEEGEGRRLEVSDRVIYGAPQASPNGTKTASMKREVVSLLGQANVVVLIQKRLKIFILDESAIKHLTRLWLNAETVLGWLCIPVIH